MKVEIFNEESSFIFNIVLIPYKLCFWTGWRKKAEYGWKNQLTGDLNFTQNSLAKIESSKNEIGAESVTKLSLPLSEKIMYNSELGLFSDLSALSSVDINWDNTFSAKVSDIIKVSFNFKLFYDQDISKSRQLQQTLAVGLTYAFL